MQKAPGRQSSEGFLALVDALDDTGIKARRQYGKPLKNERETTGFDVKRVKTRRVPMAV